MHIYKEVNASTVWIDNPNTTKGNTTKPYATKLIQNHPHSVGGINVGIIKNLFFYFILFHVFNLQI